MGRRSLEATKLLCSLMVRAAVDFFRGAWPFFLAVDFFWPADEELFFFFLMEVELLLCDLSCADEEVCAGNPLPCSSNSAARLVAINRLKNIAGISVTRLDIPVRSGIRCLFRFPSPGNPIAAPRRTSSVAAREYGVLHRAKSG